MHIQDLLCSLAIWPRAGRGGPRRRYWRIAGDGLPDVRPVTPHRLRCHHPWRLSASLSLSLSLCLSLSIASPQLPILHARPKSTVTLHDGFSPLHLRFDCDQLGRICWIHLLAIAFAYLSARQHRDGKRRMELVGTDTVVSIRYAYKGARDAIGLPG